MKRTRSAFQERTASIAFYIYRLVAEELFAAHVVGSNTGARRDVLHRFDHGGRAGEVIHRRRRIVDEALELLFVEHAFGVGHRREQPKAWVASDERLQLLEEGGVLAGPVPKREIKAVLQPLLLGVPQHAPERGDADAARDEHRRA